MAWVPGRWPPVVMTMHPLSAGAGYRYLLRHIATGDCDRAGVAPVTAYYAESGNPAGLWLGRGLAGLGDGAGLPVGMVVDEEAMERLFQRGVDPTTGAALGRAYPKLVSPADRVAAAARTLPKDMAPEARAAAVEAITRVELGRDVRAPVAGFDLTFSAMKSVSTLWALADPHVQQQILEAHRAAVGQAMALLEDRALFTRTGHGGCRQEPTRGALATAFDHWDSRSGDPNLHTHLVLANKVQGLDGAWRSVDSRALHHAVVAVSEAYNAFLVDEVARRLPVAWGWRHRGEHRSPAFELDGIEDDLLTTFSRRTSQIDAAMTDAVAQFAASHGRGPNAIEVTRLRQQVTRATRPGKKVHPLGDLLRSWRARATTVTGLSPADLTARVVRDSRTRPVRRGGLSAESIDYLAGQVLDGVRARRSTWTRWNVVAETLRVTRGLVTASPVDRVAITDAISDAVLARCLSLEAPAVFTATGRYARPDGGPVFDRPGEHVWTDTVILDAETRLLAAAVDRDAPTALVLDDALALPGRPGRRLADDQAAAVHQVAESARRVDVLVGPAGSGKTTTLAGLRRAWERQHGRGSVIGLAPSQNAAAILAQALGISCENTAKWLHESTGAGARDRQGIIARLTGYRQAGAVAQAWNGPPGGARHRGERAGRDSAMTRQTGTGGMRGLVRLRTLQTALDGLGREQARWTMRPDQLVIVDEASLAGTLALDELTRQASEAGAKLLLVGDHGQQDSVDAGGSFALLVERAGGAHLSSLWRFAHPWEATATLGLRAGDVRVLDEYEDAGRVHAGPGESMLEAAYTAWAGDVTAGYSAILLAADQYAVTALNTRAHNDRLQDGIVAPGGILTRAGEEVGVGDLIVTRLNDRRLRRAGGGFVANGDLWQVADVGADGTLTVCPAGQQGTAGADVVVLPATYVLDSVELAYACTTHRAQALTVERTHVLAHAGMTRENLYVAMSRGRDANHVYVAVDSLDTDCDDLPDPHASLDAHEVLRTILSTTGAERSATATLAARQDEATSLHRLDPIAHTLYADAALARWTDRLGQLGVNAATLGQIARSPDAGRLVAALDKIAAAAPHAAATVQALIDGLDDQADPTARLLAAAQSWLHAHIPDVDDMPTVQDATGLDPDGLALLAQIQDLAAHRVRALTSAASSDRPGWLERLGPEPVGSVAREAWLAQVAAAVAHADRSPAPAAPPVPAAPSARTAGPWVVQS
jgi:conjugative relaxase-like TrwC/TraI family protein